MFCADFYFKGFVEKLDIDAETAYPKDLFPGFELKMAERKQSTAVIGGSFEIFDVAKLVQKALHKLVTALLR